MDCKQWDNVEAMFIEGEEDLPRFEVGYATIRHFYASY